MQRPYVFFVFITKTTQNPPSTNFSVLQVNGDKLVDNNARNKWKIFSNFKDSHERTTCSFFVKDVLSSFIKSSTPSPYWWFIYHHRTLRWSDSKFRTITYFLHEETHAAGNLTFLNISNVHRVNETVRNNETSRRLIRRNDENDWTGTDMRGTTVRLSLIHI